MEGVRIGSATEQVRRIGREHGDAVRALEVEVLEQLARAFDVLAHRRILLPRRARGFVEERIDRGGARRRVGELGGIQVEVEADDLALLGARFCEPAQRVGRKLVRLHVRNLPRSPGSKRCPPGTP
jgi:hypothetical protein